MSEKLEDIGEFGFIRKISHGCLIRQKDVVKAMGDDAAAFIPADKQLTLVTTDLLVERIHFLRPATSGFNLGVKSLAVNLSDIAAMGGTAREAFVSIAIPGDCPLDYLQDLYQGLKSMAAKYDVNILGGDTTGSKVDLVINITVTGSVAPQEMLCRDGARPGDWICSTGCLGDSRAGLHLTLNRIKPDTDDFKRLYEAHILPRPYLREGRFLATSGGVTAAIDVSDGLSSDLGHLLHASNTGACIYADKLPLSASLERFCGRFGYDPVPFALAGGEDYTLLCTLSPDQAESILKGYREAFGAPLHVIGEMTASKKLEIVYAGGKRQSLTPRGWNHFKTRSHHGNQEAH